MSEIKTKDKKSNTDSTKNTINVTTDVTTNVISEISIYGLKKNNDFIYIGKKSRHRKIDNTNRNSKNNNSAENTNGNNNNSAENSIPKNTNSSNSTENKDLKLSNISYHYVNPVLHDICESNEINVVVLKDVQKSEWYNEKLAEIVSKYKDKHPLVNAQWMLEGKRGYWEGTGGYWQGKKKDKHTIDRLSESKHKKVLQYDLNGNLVKIWDSCKAVGINVFKDYAVINGSACSCIYQILGNLIFNRCAKNSHWYQYDEIKSYFETESIPNHVDIEKLNSDARLKRRSELRRYREAKIPKTYCRTYSVLEYNENNELVNEYLDIYDAAIKYNTSGGYIRLICRGERKLNNGYHLVYGKKTEKPIAEIENRKRFKAKPELQESKEPKESNKIVDNNSTNIDPDDIQYTEYHYEI